MFVVGVILFTAASFACGLVWQRRAADRGPRRAGLRRGARLAGRPLDRLDHVHARAPSATRRSASGARSAAPAPPSACSPAASSPRYLGWEWIFFVNVPVGIAVLAAAAPLRPREHAPRASSAAPTRSARSRSRPASRCSCTRSRTRRTTAGRRPARSCCWSHRVALLVGLRLIESRREGAARAGCRSSGTSTVSAANVVGFLLGAALFSNFFLLTLYVQQVLGLLGPARRA